MTEKLENLVDGIKLYSEEDMDAVLGKMGEYLHPRLIDEARDMVKDMGDVYDLAAIQKEEPVKYEPIAKDGEELSFDDLSKKYLSINPTAETKEQIARSLGEQRHNPDTLFDMVAQGLEARNKVESIAPSLITCLTSLYVEAIGENEATSIKLPYELTNQISNLFYFARPKNPVSVEIVDGSGKPRNYKGNMGEGACNINVVLNDLGRFNTDYRSKFEARHFFEADSCSLVANRVYGSIMHKAKKCVLKMDIHAEQEYGLHITALNKSMSCSAEIGKAPYIFSIGQDSNELSLCFGDPKVAIRKSKWHEDENRHEFTAEEYLNDVFSENFYRRLEYYSLVANSKGPVQRPEWFQEPEWHKKGGYHEHFRGIPGRLMDGSTNSSLELRGDILTYRYGPKVIRPSIGSQATNLTIRGPALTANCDEGGKMPEIGVNSSGCSYNGVPILEKQGLTKQFYQSFPKNKIGTVSSFKDMVQALNE